MRRPRQEAGETHGKGQNHPAPRGWDGVPAGFVAVAVESDVPEGGLVEVFVSGQPVVLCRVRDRIYACSAECTHDEESDLSQGTLNGYDLRCPEHGCEFDIRSGRILNPPAEDPLPTYEVRVENGHILVSHRPRGG